MSGVGLRAQTDEITTGTSVKTLLQIEAAANHRVKVREISVSFKGTTNSDAPIKVDVLRQTTAGTLSSLTLVKDSPGDDETLQTAATHTATAEPTAGDILMSEEVHPQTGFVWQAPFGGEMIVPGGTRLGIRATAGVSVSAVARLVGEE